jgi:hypothetical protein
MAWEPAARRRYLIDDAVKLVPNDFAWSIIAYWPKEGLPTLRFEARVVGWGRHLEGRGEDAHPGFALRKAVEDLRRGGQRR